MNKALQERWALYQSENDERMKWNIDPKSILIALGTFLIVGGIALFIW